MIKITIKSNTTETLLFYKVDESRDLCKVIKAFFIKTDFA